MRRVKLHTIVTVACLILLVLFITSDQKSSVQNSKQPDVTQPIINPNFNVAISAIRGFDLVHGNGVIVNSSGIIYTAYHIVEKSPVFQVKIGNTDYMAELIPDGRLKEVDGALAQLNYSIGYAALTRSRFHPVAGTNFNAVGIYDGPKETLYNQEVTIQGYQIDGILRKYEGIVLDYGGLQKRAQNAQDLQRLDKFYDSRSLNLFVFLPADSIYGLSGSPVLFENKLIGTVSGVHDESSDGLSLSLVKINYIDNILPKLKELTLVR